MKKILLMIVTFFCFLSIANAASKCSYDEQRTLEQEAANVRVSYELITKTVHFSDMDTTDDYFLISILNVSENLYVTVKSDVYNYNESFSYKDVVDGAINIVWDHEDTISNFTIQVYSSGNTNCSGERFKTLYLQTPRYNELSEMEKCQELTDFYLCQKYVTFKEVNRDTFIEKVNSYENGTVNEQGEEVQEMKWQDKVFNFINKNKWYFIGGAVLITASIVVVNGVRRKKQKELGL